jgi:hypothetical protein
MDPVWLGLILAGVAAFALLCAAAGISLWRDHHGAGELERWAAANGWSLSHDATGGPPWAGWSPVMIASEVSRLQPDDELRVKDVGPALAGIVDGLEVSLASVRWMQGICDEGGTISPYNASLFVAVRVPEDISPRTVRLRPPGLASGTEDRFGARFLVTPEEAQQRIPEALAQAHLAGEVSPWTVHDGRLVSICRHLVCDQYLRPAQLLPAARRGLRAARLLTESIATFGDGASE